MSGMQRVYITITASLLCALACTMGFAVANQPGPLAFKYALPADGEVTLGIYSSQGQLLRWLTRGDYRDAGNNAEAWDGLDQWGQPIPAGRYTVKGIVHPPISVDYLMTLGNPGTPPWPTVDGTGDWLSDEATPQAAATDGNWVFLAAPGNEKGPSVIAVDERGRRVWGASADINPRSVALAVSGDYLYVLYSGPELTDSSRRYIDGGANARERAILVCYEKSTGKLARFSTVTPRVKIATWPYRNEVTDLATLRTTQGYTPGKYGGQPRYASFDIGESTGALGVAVLNDRIYVSQYYDSKLLVFDATTAKPVDEIPLEKPVGVYATGATLLAVSGTSVVKVDPATKQATPVITQGLLAPHSVTTDVQGNIYVSDWLSSFQVKVFSPTGTLLRAIGKPGGRPWIGQWDASGMLVPRGIAVTNDGKLWVAEDDETPKRVSVWDAKTGAFLRDYIGPTPYGGGTNIWIDPKDGNIVYFCGMRYRIDWAKKTATPLATVFRKMDPLQPFMPNGHSMGSGLRVFFHDGKEYVGINGFHMVTILQRKGDTFVPVAAAGGTGRDSLDGTARRVWDSDLGGHFYTNYYPAFFRGHANNNFTWSDLNGDGQVQAEEMRWTKALQSTEPITDGRTPEWNGYWGAGIGPDGSIYCDGNFGNKTMVFRLDVLGWTPQGTPIYDITRAKTLLVKNMGGVFNGCYVSSENKLFLCSVYDKLWRNPNQKDSLECRDRDGNYLWGVAMPEHFSRNEFHAENIIGEFNIPGIGNVLGAWLWHGNFRPYLITSDGLYLGTMLDDTRIGPLANWDESYRYYFQAQDGTPYLVNGANDALHILPIRGLDNAKRFETTLTLTEADVQSAAAARAVPRVAAPPQPNLNMTWANTLPTIDGALDDWQGNAGAYLETNGKRMAQIALMRDANTLYLAARVQDDTPLLNKGADWQKLFITGDCIDLMLSTDAKSNPRHRTPIAGDERLLLSVFQNQPIAVRYRPVVPGTKEPIQFLAAYIDEVIRLTSARMAFQRGTDFYIFEAAIPLSDLGIDPNETDGITGDVGVVFSDETGRNRSLRLYYYNKHTEMTADLTTEATLQPNYWGQILMPLGKNLLKNGTFESPLVDDVAQGWKIGTARNGATAEITTNMAYSGKQSLLLKQTTPVIFSPESYKLPDFGDFLKSANNGQGGGYVEVSQTVPVTAGKSYAFRVRFRTRDMEKEKRNPGTPRGYCATMCGIAWAGAPGKPGVGGGVGVYDTNYIHSKDLEDWMTMLNATTRYVIVSQPYLAPEGAVKATISFRLVANMADRLPETWIDDVEFVEVADQK